MTTTDLIPSISIDTIVAKRNAIVQNVIAANQLFADAIDTARSLDLIGLNASLSLQVSSYSHRIGSFGDARLSRDLIADIDRRFWSALVEKSGVRSFMDAEAREKFEKDLHSQAPELTAENIRATFAALNDRRGELFERGVCNVFRKRSWNHKTNSPVAFGERLIIANGVERAWGGRWRLNFMSAVPDLLDDLLRVMAVLSGHPEPDHRQATRAQTEAQPWGPEQPTAIVGILGCTPALPLLEIKGYKNGNIHVRFCRPDLVEQLNKIVAKHHPNVLPAAS